MISALILDFDGLIVDTETPALESWRAIYAEHGHELGLEVWLGALGTNHGFDAAAHLADLVAAAGGPPFAREELVARRQALKMQLSAGQPLLPGVLSLLGQADALGLPCAVASSSSRRWVEGWLRSHAIYERFVCVRTAEDVVRTKPAPELFLSAAAGLNRHPATCLVFEDSPNGIRAAHAAGMRVVAVPGAIAGKDLLPPADLVLATLDELPLEEIVRIVGTQQGAL